MKLYSLKSVEEYKILIKAYQVSGNIITLFDDKGKYLNRGVVTLMTDHTFTIRESYNSKVIVSFIDIMGCRYFIG